MLEQRLEIYGEDSRAPGMIYAVQGEAGARRVRLVLPGISAGDLPAGGAPKLYILKNDGNVVMIDCTKAAGEASPAYECVLPVQACAAAGLHRAALQIPGGGKEARFDNIRLFVEPCDIEGAIASTTDLGPLGEILDKAGEATQAANSAAEKAEAMWVWEEYDPQKVYKVGNKVSYYILKIEIAKLRAHTFHQSVPLRGPGRLIYVIVPERYRRLLPLGLPKVLCGLPSVGPLPLLRGPVVKKVIGKADVVPPMVNAVIEISLSQLSNPYHRPRPPLDPYSLLAHPRRKHMKMNPVRALAPAHIDDYSRVRELIFKSPYKVIPHPPGLPEGMDLVRVVHGKSAVKRPLVKVFVDKPCMVQSGHLFSM